MAIRRPPRGEELTCSFCGASQYEVSRLISGPDVFIYNKCVEQCERTLREEKAREYSILKDIPAPEQIKCKNCIVSLDKRIAHICYGSSHHRC